MLWVFDLDGVLVHTKAANYNAYVSAGVTPPPDHHQRPWQEWCTEEQHNSKQEHFAQELAWHGQLTKMVDVCFAVRGMILTNASKRSYDIVCSVFPVLYRIPATYNFKPDEKVSWVRTRSDRGVSGIYFDDNKRVARLVDELPLWHGIHYEAET